MHAVALRALLSDAVSVLSPAERQLLSDWLDRLAASAAVRVSADDRLVIELWRPGQELKRIER